MKWLLYTLLPLCACNSQSDDTPGADTAAGHSMQESTVSRQARDIPAPHEEPPLAGIRDTLQSQVGLGETIHSGDTIRGRAIGWWYGEGSFPAKILTDKGVVLAHFPVSAVGEWMKEDFVPYEAVARWKGYRGRGKLILMRDNQSDERRFDRSVTIPVWLEP